MKSSLSHARIFDFDRNSFILTFKSLYVDVSMQVMITTL